MAGKNVDAAYPPALPAIRASAAPLGLISLGMTTAMLMFYFTTWAGAPFVNTILGYAMIFGGATQLIAGLMEYIRGSAFTGAFFSSYGCFYMGYFINSVLSAQKITSGSDETGTILWFTLWGVLTLCFFLFTLKKPICLQFAVFTLTLTFFLLAAGVKHPKAMKAGGYMGFICSVSVIYTAIVLLAAEDLGVTLPGTQVWWPVKPVEMIKGGKEDAV